MNKHISFLAITLLFVFSLHLPQARGDSVVIPDPGSAVTASSDPESSEEFLAQPEISAPTEQETAPLQGTGSKESLLTPSGLPTELLNNSSSTPSPSDEGAIPTKFSEDVSAFGESARPFVSAVWSMQGPAGQLSGADDSSDPGAQFLPSGRFEIDKRISVCAVISDPDGTNGIASAIASVFYPQASFGKSEHDGQNGCGLPKGQNMKMSSITKDDAMAVFCGSIRDKNSNLPMFASGSGYADICGGDGELSQGTAGIFCTDMELAYDDLAGEYKVLISAKDERGAVSESVNVPLTYLELTAFETDFSGLDYGKARQGAVNSVDGDLAWQNPRGENSATIRNVGNTRMKIEISQNDMGLGKTEGVWNIKYGTRLGTDEQWQNYSPEERIVLEPVFDLAEAKPVDFAIRVLRFPEDGTQNYIGKMTINALKADPIVCNAPK